MARSNTCFQLGRECCRMHSMAILQRGHIGPDDSAASEGTSWLTGVLSGHKSLLTEAPSGRASLLTEPSLGRASLLAGVSSSIPKSSRHFSKYSVRLVLPTSSLARLSLRGPADRRCWFVRGCVAHGLLRCFVRRLVGRLVRRLACGLACGLVRTRRRVARWRRFLREDRFRETRFDPFGTLP